ncbi:LysM peptidoglycan-binding domain-containing protein [Butyrivibrio sp. JL13D10]|uniref:LysM peptidoglycan-binding domain-containing protein n=1 Tax=Butyrivibrio sp. JL13D10 TaxID=3236815 RepID=UPI0038B5398C
MMNTTAINNRVNYSDNNRYRKSAMVKRKKELIVKRRLIALGILLSVAAFLIVILTFSFSSDASNMNNEDYRYYTFISVKSGDSVWTIAEEHMDDLHYRNTKEYVADIANINKISPDAKLNSGTNLIIPYYSDILK